MSLFMTFVGSVTGPIRKRSEVKRTRCDVARESVRGSPQDLSRCWLALDCRRRRLRGRDCDGAPAPTDPCTTVGHNVWIEVDIKRD